MAVSSAANSSTLVNRFSASYVLGVVTRGEQRFLMRFPFVVLVGEFVIGRELIAGIVGAAAHRPIPHRIMGKGLWIE